MFKLSAHETDRRNVSVKLPVDKIEFYQRINKNVIDNNNDISRVGDALIYIYEYYEKEGAIIEELDEQEIQDTIYRIIKEIGCDDEFIFYNPLTKYFQCTKFMEKGTTKSLSTTPEMTIIKCIACKKGEQKAKLEHIEKRLQNSSIKKILAFRKLLIDMAGHGFMSDVYFCTADARDNMTTIFSRDNKTLSCILNEMEIVDIQKVCMNTVNPKTKATPCKYLITDSHIAKIKKKDFEGMEAEYEEVIETLPQLEDKKIIEAESKEI